MEGITTFGSDFTPAPVRNPAGPAGLATAVVNSDNGKTGPTLATYASQASCPDGKNNKSKFKCPLYGSGCYAETGPGGNTTNRLNKAAGLDRKTTSADVDPLDVIKDEVAALQAVKAKWSSDRKNPYFRIHVVGDCPTTECAETLSDGVRDFVLSSPPGTKNIWAYTHAWRDVPRSAWGDHISVLASVDSEDQILEAARKGYAVAAVVPVYVQKEGKKLGESYKLDNGFLCIPCPAEVQRMVAKKEGDGGKKKLTCVDCRLCMRQDFLRDHKAVIAFAAHGSKANQIAANLFDITPGK